MRHVLSLAIVLCVLYAVYAVESRWINSATNIDRINFQRRGWRAGHNPRFENVTEMDASKLLGLNEIPIAVSSRAARDVAAATGLPEDFDSRTKWPACNMPIRDQLGCGGCWAFASASVFGARMCIQSGGAVKIDMAPQMSISCNSANSGCSGGALGIAWDFLKTTGTVAESDYPFTSKTGNSGSCSINNGAKRYYAASYSRPSTVAAMQQAIYDSGPIQVGMDVYSDFYNYKSGVYSKTSNSLSGGHSVYLVGWGTDDYGTDYWIGVNSWSTGWGMNGVFYIVRGQNMCNIEKGYVPIYGVVAASSIPSATTKTTTKPTSLATTIKVTSTTKAPAASPVTSAPARNCWTCPSGYVHWYDISGMAEPSDKCACVVKPATSATTKAPATSPVTSAPARNCWTCPSGYVHWYDISGMAEPSDKCACVVKSSTAATSGLTKAPALNCWTCPSGYVHWYDIAGMTEPNDKCACVPKP